MFWVYIYNSATQKNVQHKYWDMQFRQYYFYQDKNLKPSHRIARSGMQNSAANNFDICKMRKLYFQVKFVMLILQYRSTKFVVLFKNSPKYYIIYLTGTIDNHKSNIKPFYGEQKNLLLKIQIFILLQYNFNNIIIVKISQYMQL